MFVTGFFCALVFVLRRCLEGCIDGQIIRPTHVGSY